MYDVIIVGAGPAGATLARLIGNDFRVLLIERRQLTEPHTPALLSAEKCCGGLLAPDAQAMLARFGLGIPQKLLTGPQLFTVRTIDLDNSLEQCYQRHYLNVDREKFDRWLAAMIPATVTLRYGSIFKKYETELDRIKITYLGDDGVTHSEYTKVLVGADGAFSQVRKQTLANAPSPKMYLSIQEWFESQATIPYYSAIFDRSITDFYAWTIPKENAIIVGAALPLKPNPIEQFELLKTRLKDYGFEFGESIKKRGAYLVRPLKLNQIFTGKGNIVLTGEAAGWISPSSAEGISYAFKSALALAESIKESLHNTAEIYAKKSGFLKRNILSKNLKSPFMYYPLIRKWVMRSRVQSLNIINTLSNLL